jgi:UDP-N-acetylglucosamine--N-acetylmuramyl-(pentapeptide) pyrophosphoryl-undecaprenol N-acetylglucosamine transferase
MKESNEDTKNYKTSKIAITGGGSGGHLNAAIAVIQELEKRNPEIFRSLIYIGGKRGMIGDPTPSIESRKVPELGVAFIAIRSGKFHRKFSFLTLKLLFGVLGGMLDAFKVIKKQKPDLVFSTGGYVSVPVVIVAWMFRIPIIIHEQTIVSGLANRISAKFAKKILISFQNSYKYFPKKKTLLVGNPLQKSRFVPDLPRDIDSTYQEFLERFVKEKQSKPFIFITGGGLGSHIINQWFVNHVETLVSKYNIIIQTGLNQLHKDYEKLSKLIKHSSEAKNSIYPIQWFGKEIGYIYSHVDLVISRPGANTVLELLATNCKAVLIPIAWAAQNEQQLNAEYFLRHQSSAIVQQNKIDEELSLAIEKVLEMETKDSARFVKRNAASTIAKMLSEFPLK